MRRQKTDRQAISVLRSYFSKLQIADKDADLDRDPYESAGWLPKTLSNGNSGTIDWVADFGLPEIPKMVWLSVTVRDSASAGARYFIALRARTTTTNYSLVAQSEPAVNDLFRNSHGCVAVADNGTTFYWVLASGVNSMDVYIRVVAWSK